LLLLGHTGISLGLAWLLTRPKGPDKKRKRVVRADLRLILLGSMLPDLIDKPLGFLCWGLSMGNGRTLAHTLLFFIILLLGGLFCALRKKRPGLLTLALASGAHLIFDKMWQYPVVFFWPAYGLKFPLHDKLDILSQIKKWLYTLQTEPFVFLPEIAGGIILFLLFVRAVRNNELKVFWREGKLS